MKIIIALVTGLVLFFSFGCEKSEEIPKLPVNEYESCCGAEPVEFSVLDSSYVYIPNVFTPNGDGVNDLFRPYFNGKIPGFLSMFIYTMENDTILYYLDGTLFIDTDIANYGWDGIRWETHEYTKHIGGFRYEIVFYVFTSNQNTVLYTIEGVGCAVECDENAKIFKTKEDCFFPDQTSNGSFLDKKIETSDLRCFE